MRSDTVVIKTKIMVPRRRSEVLTRPRLLSILDDILDVKLLILAAPAGYGKTSLLVDFAYNTRLPICWLGVDNLDCDPQRFIAHFIAALSMRFPAFGKIASAALADLSQDNLNYDPVIAAIVNDAYENITEHFVFILDDYHLIRDCKSIEPFINRVVQEMAENCHFIISSRVLLTLPDLSLLVARNQVAGLSFEELAFLPEEVKKLIATNFNQTITDERAEEMVSQTEGWITGLLLTTQLSTRGSEDRVRLAKVSGIGVYEYLAQQVFDRQSEEVQQFLLRTSLLEEFNAPMCSKVIGHALSLGHYPWQNMVQQILRDNLFVLSVGDETQFIRYHHLFRDFLQNRMRLLYPEDAVKIEKALARNCVEKHLWEQAYAIYSRLGDDDSILKLIYEAAPFLINSGKLITLSNWFDQVPGEKLQTAPELISIQATILLVRGDVAASIKLLDRAIEGLKKSHKESDLGRSLNRRSIANNHLGNYVESLQDADEAIALTENKPGLESIRAEAFRMRGLSLFQQGDLLGSLDALNNSRYLFESFGNKEDIAGVLMELGIAQRRLGNFDSAEKAYQDALERWQTSGNSMWQANVLNNLGFLQNLRGQYEQAAMSFERSLQHARLAAYPRMEGFALLSLADLYRDLRAIKEAQQTYQMAQDIVTRTQEKNLNIYLALSNVAVLRIEQQYTEALEAVKQTEALAKKGGFTYEINLCRLEQVTLALKMGKTDGVEEEINYLSSTFERQRNLTEAFQANLLKVVYLFQKKKWVQGQGQFQELFDSKLHDTAKNIMVQVGLEFKEVFEQTAAHLLDFEPLVDMLDMVKEFEARSPEIRRALKRQSNVIQFTNYQLSIKAFGRMQVKLSDHIITSADWKSQTSRDLFFYLLAHPVGVTKEEIGIAFWPDSTTDELRLRFKNCVYRLRRAVGNDVVKYNDDETYQFNRAVDYEYDVEKFMREISLAKNAEGLDAQIKHLKAAVSVYLGPFMPKGEQSWIIAQREQYQQLFIENGLILANLLMQQGHHSTAIQYSKRILDQDPCNEAAYRLLMVIYASMEDRASVKRQYELCRQTLMNELGVEPTDTTRNLFDTLMR